MTYWLVGESDTAQPPLTPDETGFPNIPNRLLNLTGWTIGQFLSIFEERETVWKRQNWHDIGEGRQRAAEISERAIGSAGVVVVGYMAAAAFGLTGELPFDWCGRYAMVPNPDPARLARYWKVPGTRERATSFFDGILESAGRSRRPRARVPHHKGPRRGRAWSPWLGEPPG